MSIGHDILTAGTELLMRVLDTPWSVDGCSEIHMGLFDNRSGNELTLAALRPDAVATLVVRTPDYCANCLTVGRRVWVRGRPYVIVAEDFQDFRVLLQLASPDQ